MKYTAAELNTAEAVKFEEEINKEKKQTGMMLQIISAENGERSEPFIATWEELHQVLSKEMDMDESEMNVKEKDYILLVAVMQGEETRIPRAPLITIESFLKMEINKNG